MSDLFATQVTGGLTGSKSALTGATLTTGKNEAQTIDFWKFILGQITDEELRTDINSKDTKEDIFSDRVKGEKVDLALLQLALLGQDADTDLNQKLADLQIERVALKQENRIEQLTKLVNHLTSGLPAAAEGGTVEDLVQRLNNRLETLQASLDSFRTGDFGADGSPFKLLIATGLNPAQLTTITNRIEEVESKLGRELTVEDLVAGVGNIVPAPGDDDHEFSAPDALGLVLEKAKETDVERIEREEKEEQQEVSITDLSTPNAIDDSGVISLTNPIEQALKRVSNNPSEQLISKPLKVANDTDASVENADSEELILTQEAIGRLSNAEFREFFGNNKMQNVNNGNIVQGSNTPQNNLQNLNNAVQNNSLNALPPLTISEAASFAQSVLSEALGFDIQTGTPFTQTAQAAHLASAPGSVAGQQHPATKMVSAHIAKAANNGETKAITLMLDPPELGRVEIRLEFGKEKSVKAHLVVEKPETLLMLQRDASALEKTLQDSGLSADSDSLNYEMAAEDHAFGSNRDNQNGPNGKTGTDLESNLEDEIFTEMTWDVDPETGHVHYSILA